MVSPSTPSRFDVVVVRGRYTQCQGSAAYGLKPKRSAFVTSQEWNHPPFFNLRSPLLPAAPVPKSNARPSWWLL